MLNTLENITTITEFTVCLWKFKCI